jgi:GAF domain-containing protein
VVWLANPDGAELQPVLSHGYNDNTRARLPNVPRAANNAAAAAYRSGDLQIVLSRPGGAKGAIVAPILGSRGCIGALSAEIRGGGEASESVQALAAIVAAQLAGVLAAPPAENSRAIASS